MNSRKERLVEVYDHLRSHFGIHTKTQFASVLKLTQPALSSAINGNESYLTDNLFKRICAAFQGVFNLDYLLTGEGELLSTSNASQQQSTQNDNHAQAIEPSSMVNAIISSHHIAIASKDETITSLQQQLQSQEESLKREIQSKDEIIQSLREQLRDKENLIAEQKARLIDYRRIIDSNVSTSNWPFPIGAADQQNNKRAKI